MMELEAGIENSVPVFGGDLNMHIVPAQTGELDFLASHCACVSPPLRRLIVRMLSVRIAICMGTASALQQFFLNAKILCWTFFRTISTCHPC